MQMLVTVLSAKNGSSGDKNYIGVFIDFS